MAKINYSRPSLRYLDNFRRELKRENRPSPTWFKPDKAAVLGFGNAHDDEFSEHIIAFSKLPIEQQEIVDRAFAAFGNYTEALTHVISLIMSGNSKRRKKARLAREQAEEDFIIAGAVLIASIFEDLRCKRSGFLHWFEKFYNDLDRESQFAWADFGEKLFHDCTALFIAQQISDNPDRVQEIRQYLLVEDDD